jgi:hypothetical protein
MENNGIICGHLNILLAFCIFCSHFCIFLYFVFYRFGMLYQEKSGSPALEAVFVSLAVLKIVYA